MWMWSLVIAAVSSIIFFAALFTVYAVHDNHCLSRDGKERSYILFIVGMLLSDFLGVALLGTLALDYACGENGVLAVHSVLQFSLFLFLAALAVRYFSSYGHILVAASEKASTNTSNYSVCLFLE